MPDARIQIETISKAPRIRCWCGIASTAASITAGWLWCIPSANHVRTQNDRPGFIWMLTLLVATSFMLPCATNCSDPKPEVFSVLNKARTEDGEPLPGLRVLENGKSRGQTDETGVLFLRIRGFRGQRITLSGACPEGYRKSI
jgi:hypothetical protein